MILWPQIYFMTVALFIWRGQIYHLPPPCHIPLQNGQKLSWNPEFIYLLPDYSLLPDLLVSRPPAWHTKEQCTLHVLKRRNPPSLVHSKVLGGMLALEKPASAYYSVETVWHFQIANCCFPAVPCMGYLGDCPTKLSTTFSYSYCRVWELTQGFE